MPVAAKSVGKSLGRLEREVIEATNQYRKQQGLPPLQAHPTLTRLARQHSEAMASGRRSMGHAGMQQRFVIIQKEIKGVRGFWENVAMGYSDASSVLKGWVNSSGHRRNLKSPSSLIGVGIARDRQGRLYYTQLFVQ